MHTAAHTSAKKQIDAIFEGKLFVSPKIIGESFGWKPQTTYCHVSNGTFPVSITEICGKKFVSLVDFTNFILREVGEVQALPQQQIEVKRQRGRPTNASQSSTVLLSDTRRGSAGACGVS